MEPFGAPCARVDVSLHDPVALPLLSGTARLVASAMVASVTVVEEYALPDRGYFRARLGLTNHDFLEVAEYFVVEAGYYVTKRYRYQGN